MSDNVKDGTEEIVTETTTQKRVNTLKKLAAPLLTVALGASAAALLVKATQGSKTANITPKDFVDQNLAGGMHNNRLVLVDANTGELRYILEYGEPSDGGSKVNWDDIYAAGLSDRKENEWLVITMDGDERYCSHFVCTKAGK